MANILPTRPVKNELTSIGAQVRFYRMLGNAGGGAGDKSIWREVHYMQRMTFVLYPAGDDQSAGITTQVANIEAAMELDVSDPQGQTSGVVIATLNSGARIVTIDHKVRYVRAVVTAGAGAQVGLQAFGV